MVALAGEKLNLVLQDLKLNRDLKVNRVTTTLQLQGGTNGPFNLPMDYLRTYDMFFPLQGPNGMTQFLHPITMEQYDQEFKAAQTANYPYEFATDLSTQAQAASGTPSNTGTVDSVTVGNPGTGYVNPPGAFFTGGGGTGATCVPHLSYLAAAIPAGGAGYTAGDILTVVGGAGLRPARFSATVAAGVVVGVVPIDGGDYTTYPGIAAATTGGTGAGCTLTLANGIISSILVTNPGSGYTSAPAVTILPQNGFPTATAVLGTTGAQNGKGQLYIYPQSTGLIAVTHRYMRDQPDIANPSTSTETPWFPYDAYLIKATAEMMMGITGDDRQPQYSTRCEEMLRPHLIMEGDEQQTVHAVRLDPRHFRTNRGLRPTKQNPW